MAGGQGGYNPGAPSGGELLGQMPSPQESIADQIMQTSMLGFLTGDKETAKRSEKLFEKFMENMKPPSFLQQAGLGLLQGASGAIANIFAEKAASKQREEEMARFEPSDSMGARLSESFGAPLTAQPAGDGGLGSRIQDFRARLDRVRGAG
jgi:hypothetical protein